MKHHLSRKRCTRKERSGSTSTTALPSYQTSARSHISIKSCDSGEINAKSLIVSNIALDPLGVRTEPVQHLVRLRGIDDMALAAAYTENWMRRAASSRSLGDFRP